MKKLNLNLILGALIIASMLTFVSCSKDQHLATQTEEVQLPQIPEAKPGIATNITNQNGILKFETLEDFKNTLLALNTMTPQAQLEWENSLSFVSMQQTFNAIVKAEFETIGAHSTVYNENLLSGLIAGNETTGLYDLNLFNPAYAPVLNGKGLVIVGNTIYQFTGNALKIWENGDSDRLDYLLNTTSASQDVHVVPMNFQGAAQRNVPTWTDECESGNNSGMIRLTAFYNSDFLAEGNPDIVFIEYFINVHSMIMTSGNEWEFDPNASVRLQGRSELRFTLTNGTMERSMNQVRTYNQIIGFGGNFTFIPLEAVQYNFPDPWVFVNPIHLLRANWIAQNKLSDGTSFSCGFTF